MLTTKTGGGKGSMDFDRQEERRSRPASARELALAKLYGGSHKSTNFGRDAR